MPRAFPVFFCFCSAPCYFCIFFTIMIPPPQIGCRRTSGRDGGKRWGSTSPSSRTRPLPALSSRTSPPWEMTAPARLLPSLTMCTWTPWASGWGSAVYSSPSRLTTWGRWATLNTFDFACLVFLALTLTLALEVVNIFKAFGITYIFQKYWFTPFNVRCIY